MRQTGLEEFTTYYDIIDDPHAKERLIQATGRQTVPCLFIDGKPMHESRDIAAWLHNYAKEIAHGGDKLSGN